MGDLATRATVPVEVVAAPEERLSEAVEATVYFVVSECLANIGKHSQATVASVRVETEGDLVVVEVADDGVGGVELDGGSGIQGLGDRVGALDGRLEVTSPPGSGTRVVARIPLIADGDGPATALSGVRVFADEDAEAIASRRRELWRPRLLGVTIVAAVLVAIWALTPSPTFWPIWPLIGLAAVAAIDALITLVALPVRESELDPGAGDRASAARAVRGRRFLVVKAGLILIVNLVVIAVWLASGAGYFWPVWVLLGTSVALVVEYARSR